MKQNQIDQAYRRGVLEWSNRWGGRRNIETNLTCICRDGQKSLPPRGQYFSEHLNGGHELECALANTAGDVLYYAAEAFQKAVRGNKAGAQTDITEALRLEALHAPILLRDYGAAWEALQQEINSM